MRIVPRPSCAAASPAPHRMTMQREVKITREELGNSWPFTASEGTLACHGGEVVFTANSKTYAVNGMTASSKKSIAESGGDLQSLGGV